MQDIILKEAVSRYLSQHKQTGIHLKAVLFDMDGVLFNSMPYHADSWHTVMERHGLHLSREEAFLHEGRTGAATINIVYRRQYGQDAAPELVKRIYAEKSEEFASHPEPERMPGAWELMQKVKACGLTPVLVTGSGRIPPALMVKVPPARDEMQEGYPPYGNPGYRNPGYRNPGMRR